MIDVRLRRGLIAATALTVAVGATAVSAAAPPEPTPVATALTNPRGFIWDDSGNLVVALAGSGGTSPPTEDTPTNAIIGPFGGGLTAAVASDRRLRLSDGGGHRLALGIDRHR